MSNSTCQAAVNGPDNSVSGKAAALEQEQQESDRKNQVGEIRLSFIWYFVVIKWGRERRSAERIQHERELHPVLKRAHVPILATMWAILFFAAYAILALSLRGLVMGLS